MKRRLLLLLTLALALVLSLGILTACGTDKEFTITIKDGDTVLKTVSIAKDAVITVDPDDSAFDKAGYEVEGLYTDAALAVEFDGEVTATADLTLYIKYTPRPFKIIVIDDPNSVNYTSVDVTYNSAYTLTAPSRTGYLFLGYTHVQDGTPVSFPLSGTYTKTNTISISAQWKKLASITVYDELTDEKVGTTIYADAEGNFTLPAVTATTAGYNFGGYVIPGVTLTKQNDGSYTGKVTTDGDLTATLKWTPVPTYLLTVNGLYGTDAVAPASYKTGATFTLPAAPTRTGYFFTGYTVNGQPLTLDNGAATFTWSEATTITANWRKQATITVYDGSSIVETIKVPENGAYTLTVPNNTATHIFAGFTSGGEAFATNGTYAGETDLTVIRNWTAIPTYLLTIVGLYGDDVVAPASYKTGDTFTLPANPTRDGYIFAGYTVNDQPLTATNGTYTFTWTAATTVTANWTPRVYITVQDELTNAILGTVEVIDGAYDLSAYVLTGEDAEKTDGVKNYTYNGFILNNASFDVTGTYTGGSVTVIRDWSGVDKIYLTIISVGASKAEYKAEIADGAYTLPTMALDGYHFDGFYTDAECTLPVSGESGTATDNVTLYAKWRKQATIRVLNGSTVMETITVPASGAYTLTVPEDTATHTFEKFTNNGVDFEAVGTYTGEADLIILQVWEAIPTYLLTVEGLSGSDVVAPATYKNGDTFTLPANPTRDGYFFIGYRVGTTAITANNGVYTFTWSSATTVTAIWEKQTTVTIFDSVTGGKINSVVANKDGNFVLPAVTEIPEGYTFGGYVIPGVTLTKQNDGSYIGTAKEAELTATLLWNPIPKFNWSVYAGGGTFVAGVATSGTAYESTAIALPEPTRDGYVFMGYAYGDGTKLAKDGALYILPAHAAVQTTNLKLTAVWEVDTNAKGEQFDKTTGVSREFFSEVVGNELVYVFLTGRSYYFGAAELTFGGNYATAITKATDPEKGNGFEAIAPGSFTMTQNGQTVNCRVEYYVGSMGAGSNTTGRIESNFKGSIDKEAFDAGIVDFLPDLVGGTVSIDKIPYEIVSVVDDKGKVIAPNLYWIEANGKLSLDPNLINGTDPVETLTITYKAKYGLKGDNVTASVTIRPNEGVNVYTNDELYAAYADLEVNTINILRNITAALQPQHYALTADGRVVVHNDDYANGVYVRLPQDATRADAPVDDITINGNCYTIDASKIPAINPELVAVEEDDDFYAHDDAYYGRWADGYTGWDDGVYQLVNVQAAIFVYYHGNSIDGDSVAKAGGTLHMNDLYITGNEFEITKALETGTTKSYWEKTYDLNQDGSKVVVGSSGAMHGIIVRQANAVLDNVKIDHTQSGVHTDGYDHTYKDTNEIGHAGTPTALLTKITINNAIFDQNFNSSFFAWGQVGLEITNSKLGRSAGPAIIFSDTPITSAEYQSEINIDANTVIENFVSGAEPWFQAYRADGAAKDVKAKLAGDGSAENPGFYPSIKATGYPALLTPIKEAGNDKIETFNAMIVTNSARSDDWYNEDHTVVDADDGIPVGVPFVKISIGGSALSTTPAMGNSPEIPPLPLSVGTKFYQHLPMTGTDASSMQVILEAFVK